MSWLLFMDESGHDHKSLPYEVRGGFALDIEHLWPFIRSIKSLEVELFGLPLSRYQTEIKGEKLLKKKRFRHAEALQRIEDGRRKMLIAEFLTKGKNKEAPTKDELSAYGQASLFMVDGIFECLRRYKAKIFATAIPRGLRLASTQSEQAWLRRDHTYLLERYFYHLEACNSNGILVMDEVEKQNDKRFIARLDRYFMKTKKGKERAKRLVPTPFFVSSDMSYAIQVADVVIYCINHGFRISGRGMDAPVRDEIESRFSDQIRGLQYVGQAYHDKKGEYVWSYGITFVGSLE